MGMSIGTYKVMAKIFVARKLGLGDWKDISRIPVKDYGSRYRAVFARLRLGNDRKKAMSLAVGGSFELMGAVMREVLIKAGLRPDSYLIDVGCGSGRLAAALSEWSRGPYLGLDVVPELLEYAGEIARKPGWRFELLDSVSIPERDGSADMTCFFSVFTHLLHEDIYRYFLESHRVLKPGGKMVFSFLEFKVGPHWRVFSGMIDGSSREHDQFISRDAIEAWALHAGFEIEQIWDGDQPHVSLPAPIRDDNGTEFRDGVSFGQSVCILRKKSPSRP